MGLGFEFVEALIRENQHRQIGGDVVLIGRQTVYFDAPGILAFMRNHGMNTDEVDASKIELDRYTLNRLERYEHSALISDRALFQLLGVPKITALDHSNYEGAEIIHDLAKPIPDRLVESADFIVDGSTLDNVFDPAMVIRNYASMLRPGGRLLTINIFSNHHYPYVMLPPLWYADYFIANRFADCKIYILVISREVEDDTGPETNRCNVFIPDMPRLADRLNGVTPFAAPRMTLNTIVLAEKGPQSTFDIMPAQQHYRGDDQHEIYCSNLEYLTASSRPHLVRSRDKIFFHDVRRGHLYMDQDFNPHDPSTEIRRLETAGKTLKTSNRRFLSRPFRL